MIKEFAREMGIVNYFEVGRMGVEHALLPEKGLVVPGDVVIGADSHTCTYGALGAFSTGIGSTDMAAGMATGEAWFKVPEAIRFVLKGKVKGWVSGKDVILHIIGMIGVNGIAVCLIHLIGLCGMIPGIFECLFVYLKNAVFGSCLDRHIGHGEPVVH
jgi:homoaconitase/3-isopropylmalate dehydratase large subunit